MKDRYDFDYSKAQPNRFAEKFDMKILGLPGKKPATHQWLNALIDAIDLNYTAKQIQSYDCWQTPTAELDETLETTRAQQFDPDLIIAKSLGTIVALMAFAETADRRKFILIGIPLEIYSAEEIATLNRLATTGAVLIIQQTADPAYSADELRKALNQPEIVAEISGNDHAYSDIDQLCSLITPWLKEK